jgi:hypothetical protein
MNKSHILTKEEVETNIAQAKHSERAFIAQSLMTPPPQPVETIQPKIEQARSEVNFWKNVLNS